jgi:hypothetical protein
MFGHSCPESRLQRASVLIAAGFGLLSLFAGGRVLLGLSTPDHAVVQPLLLFNTVMGAVYIAVALRIRADAARGRIAAAAVAVLNLVVWLALIAYAATGAAVAVDSLVAMGIRSAVWGTIFLMLGRVARSPRVGHA